MKLSEKQDAVLRGLKEVCRQETLKDFRPDSCIASTRIVCRVLKEFGFEVEPFPVLVIIQNAAFQKAASNGDIPPPDNKLFYAWCERTGAWSVGVGFPDPDKSRADGYGGHLVALLPKHNMIVDSSIDQANRPQYSIHLPTVLVAEFAPEFLSEEGYRLCLRNDEGCFMYYEKLVNPVWRTAPDWVDTKRTKRAVKAIIAHIERMVG